MKRWRPFRVQAEGWRPGEELGVQYAKLETRKMRSDAPMRPCAERDMGLVAPIHIDLSRLGPAYRIEVGRRQA